MKNIVGIFAVMVLFFAMFMSCKKKNKEETKVSYTPSCTSTTPSFSATVKPLIQSTCVSCHSEYSTYTQISASSSSIRSNIVSGAMPKGTTLSEAQKNSIVCWIDAGKPNN
ncbi:MAG: hypothetical protein IPL10_07560 [Bacteroidetes bacterium]|nr:hypothetical protein [Bacteroidota bacterium]